jgi:hypothetical protein
MTLHEIASFIVAHGFSATVADGAVTFCIPFVNVVTRHTGFHVETVRTMAEARRALGY